MCRNEDASRREKRKLGHVERAVLRNGPHSSPDSCRTCRSSLQRSRESPAAIGGVVIDLMFCGAYSAQPAERLAGGQGLRMGPEHLLAPQDAAQGKRWQTAEARRRGSLRVGSRCEPIPSLQPAVAAR